MKAVAIYDHSTQGLGYLAAAYFSYFADKKGGCSIELAAPLDEEIRAHLQQVLMEDNLYLDPGVPTTGNLAYPQLQIPIAAPWEMTDIGTPTPGLYFIEMEDELDQLPALERYRKYREVVKREMLRIIGKESLFSSLS